MQKTTHLAVLYLVGLAACSAPTATDFVASEAACDVPVVGGGGPLVTVKTDRRFQTIAGFGSTERVFDDPHVTETFDSRTGRGAVVVPAAEQAKILEALYKELGLTRVRYNPRDPSPGVVSGIEPVNDNDNPLSTDLSKFDFAWKNNDAHIAYVRAARAYGLSTYFASPLTLETWMRESEPAEYAEWAMAILRRWRDQGLEMPYFSLVNEPGYSVAGPLSANFLRAATIALGSRIRAEGMSTKLVIPDDLNPVEAYMRASVVLADATARQYVGAIAYHLYGDLSNRDKLKALSDTYGIPIWMTEYALAAPFEWADLIHEEIVDFGASAVDMQWGFFGQWENTDSHLITIRHSGNNYTGFERTKSFYTMGQYSRFVRPGAQRVEVVGAEGIKVSAFIQDATITIVAIGPNDGTTKTVTFDVSGARCSGTVSAVRTSATENWTPVTMPSLSARRFEARIPPGSITTFTLQ